MQELKFYVCSVCNIAYKELELAEQCERRGIEEVRVKVGGVYDMSIDALTDPLSWLRQKKTVVKMRVEVVEVEGPLAHESHSLLGRFFNNSGEPEICRHFSSHHQGPHVFHVHYSVVSNNDPQAVLPDDRLYDPYHKKGRCSQENFLRHSQ